MRRACQPVFTGIRFEGAATARPASALVAALGDPALEAIIICPSNPILSIGPMLAVPSIAEALRAAEVPCIAISPFIGGEAVKGPAGKIMPEQWISPGAAALAHPYAGTVDAILCDHADADAGRVIAGIHLVASATLMRDDAGQQRLARECLALATSLHNPREQTVQ